MALDETFEPATKLFKMIREEVGLVYPVTVYLQSCHSGASMRQCNDLPQGATLIALVPEEEVVWAGEYSRAWKALVPRTQENERLQADGYDLLFNYLFTSGTQHPPVMKTADGRVLDTKQLLLSQAGQSFSEDKRQRIYERLADKFIGSRRLDYFIGLVESYSFDRLKFTFPMAALRSYETELLVNDIMGDETPPLDQATVELLADPSEGGSDYGPCLAVCLAAELL
jgi:hypothetical protein